MILKEQLSEKRYAHSVGVAETARTLAERFGADPEKAYLAGILHDCAKRCRDRQAMLVQAAEYGVQPDEIERIDPYLLHARLGAVIAREEFGVTDEEALRAIRLHIYGTPEMTTLDLALNVADYIEPGRHFPGVDKLREYARESLHKALFYGLSGTMTNLLGKGMPLHPDSVFTYNTLYRMLDT